MFLTVHRLREKAERLADLALFLRSDVVLFCEFGLARLGRGGSASSGSFALWRLNRFVRIRILPWEDIRGSITICASVGQRAVAARSRLLMSRWILGGDDSGFGAAGDSAQTLFGQSAQTVRAFLRTGPLLFFHFQSKPSLFNILSQSQL
jgi:hypothetical protein